MPVMSLRLSQEEYVFLNALAREEHKEKSTEARELLKDGFKYKMLLAYKNNKISLGNLSKKLDLSISETIDFLADFGITAPIDYDDYLQGAQIARDAIQ